jgi:hypothetical protein
MSSRQQYTPGPATGARIEKDGEKWTLVLVRELRHPPERIWQALTDPAQLREWTPFDADGSLAIPGATVKLTTVGAPAPHVTETKVTRAEAPKLLEYNWGGFDMRWQLDSLGPSPASRCGPTSRAPTSRWAPPAGTCASMCSITTLRAPHSAGSSAPRR